MTTPAELTCRCLFFVAVTSLCCLSPEAGAQDAAPSAEGWHLVTIPDAWRKMPSGNLNRLMAIPGTAAWFRFPNHGRVQS